MKREVIVLPCSPDEDQGVGLLGIVLMEKDGFIAFQYADLKWRVWAAHTHEGKYIACDHNLIRSSGEIRCFCCRDRAPEVIRAMTLLMMEHTKRL